jgi:hypothetical protein
MHLMRFVMAEREFTTDETLAFLRALGDALDAFITTMETFARGTSPSAGHGALALSHGLAVHRASLQWVHDASASLKAAASAANEPARPLPGARLAATPPEGPIESG